MQTAKKKRIIVGVAAVFLAAAMMTFGTALAMLTKTTEQRANNFTFGSITIKLEEEEWDKEDHTVYPGRVVAKDPLITNQGKNPLYAYLEVWVPYRKVSYVVPGKNGEADAIEGPKWRELVNWEESMLGDGWEQIGDAQEKTDDEDNTIKYMVYRFAYTRLVYPRNSDQDNKTSKLFEQVTFLETILEGEPEGEETFEMPIYAYAIQAEYVDDMEGNDLLTKMTKAFEEYMDERSS